MYPVKLVSNSCRGVWVAIMDSPVAPVRNIVTLSDDMVCKTHDGMVWLVCVLHVRYVAFIRTRTHFSELRQGLPSITKQKPTGTRSRSHLDHADRRSIGEVGKYTARIVENMDAQCPRADFFGIISDIWDDKALRRCTLPVSMILSVNEAGGSTPRELRSLEMAEEKKAPWETKGICTRQTSTSFRIPLTGTTKHHISYSKFEAYKKYVSA